MKITEFTLPTHWAPCLINGDDTGYDDDELDQICQVMNHLYSDYGTPSDISEDAGFLKYHDAEAFGVLACDCSVYTFIKD